MNFDNLREEMRSDKRSVEILLVEDNPADARLTAEALKQSKVVNNLHVAMDGEQAMSFLRREAGHEDAATPDLILLDLNMPRKDGREVLREIKTDDALKMIPVVIMTTSREEQDVTTSYSSHANCYIRKPLDVNGLFDVVTKIENFWFEIVVLPPVD
jgi:chemotaxis family two-component system response regulator Rcp1